jgi:hypothetical protein
VTRVSLWGKLINARIDKPFRVIRGSGKSIKGQAAMAANFAPFSAPKNDAGLPDEIVRLCPIKAEPASSSFHIVFLCLCCRKSA